MVGQILDHGGDSLICGIINLSISFLFGTSGLQLNLLFFSSYYMFFLYTLEERIFGQIYLEMINMVNEGFLLLIVLGFAHIFYQGELGQNFKLGFKPYNLIYSLANGLLVLILVPAKCYKLISNSSFTIFRRMNYLWFQVATIYGIHLCLNAA